ncbi:MAG TPA: hypothetical protein VE985_04895 [Gaiellaceae bacterium]|nr:hypothetical protein [Gaiellaceae bacterium]
MIALRRSVPLFVALVLLGLAVVFALLARDVRAWQRTFTRGDVSFRTVHGASDLWHSPATIPGDPARRILGVGDALAYRHALQLFWLSEVGVAHAAAASGSLTQAEVNAEQDLQALVDHAKTGAERSAAANLLGVMTIRTPVSDSETQTGIIDRAASYFRQAIGLDPTNWAAKVNLEFVLRITRPDKSRFGTDAHGGFGSGGSEGAGIIGGGF